MKRRFALLVALALAVSCLGGCTVSPLESMGSALDRAAEKIESNAVRFGERIERWLSRSEEELEDWAAEVEDNITGNLQDYDNLSEDIAKIEVYDASSGALLKTITEESTIAAFEESLSADISDQFSGISDLSAMTALLSTPKGLTAQYRFDVYKASVAKANKGELYVLLSVTSYQGSRYVTAKLSSELMAQTGIPKAFSKISIELPQNSIDELNTLAAS